MRIKCWLIHLLLCSDWYMCFDGIIRVSEFFVCNLYSIKVNLFTFVGRFLAAKKTQICVLRGYEWQWYVHTNYQRITYTVPIIRITILVVNRCICVLVLTWSDIPTISGTVYLGSSIPGFNSDSKWSSLHI